MAACRLSDSIQIVASPPTPWQGSASWLRLPVATTCAAEASATGAALPPRTLPKLPGACFRFGGRLVAARPPVCAALSACLVRILLRVFAAFVSLLVTALEPVTLLVTTPEPVTAATGDVFRTTLRQIDVPNASSVGGMPLVS